MKTRGMCDWPVVMWSLDLCMRQDVPQLLTAFKDGELTDTQPHIACSNTVPQSACHFSILVKVPSTHPLQAQYQPCFFCSCQVNMQMLHSAIGLCMSRQIIAPACTKLGLLSLPSMRLQGMDSHCREEAILRSLLL